MPKIFYVCFGGGQGFHVGFRAEQKNFMRVLEDDLSVTCRYAHVVCFSPTYVSSLSYGTAFSSHVCGLSGVLAPRPGLKKKKTPILMRNEK